jgi:iron complex transport system permease protein
VKIVLDLTKLVHEGKLTPAQAEELKLLSARDTGLLAINILLAFGTIAVAAGVLLLVPSLPTAAGIAVLLIAGGLTLSYGAGLQWTILGTATTIIGALWLSAVGVSFTDGRWYGFAGATALCLACAVAIRSSLLSALAALALAATLDSGTGYEHATYILIVQQPTVTIVCFGLLAWIAYLIAQRVPADYEPLALNFARISLVLVNFGFWCGSLFGDDPGKGWLWQPGGTAPIQLPDLGFVIAWAAGLIGVGLWAAQANRRFVVNLAATFFAIDFYTQWFERLGAEPLSIALGGLLVIAIAVALWRYNAVARPAKAAAA